MPKLPEKSFLLADGTTVFFRGPDLDKGPLPAVLYFALSGRESLFVDPYNKPAEVMEQGGIRVFSIDLPFHGEGFDNLAAMGLWVEALQKEPFFLASFIHRCRQVLDFIIIQKYANPEYLGVAGLSRGGYVATLLAASDDRIRAILGFAPLVDLSCLNEYHAIQPHASHKLKELSQELTRRQICYFIGNRDERVGTSSTFACIQAFTEANYQAGVRSPPVELHLFPSIGHKGHGTPVEIFEKGANWMLAQLNPAH